MDIHENQPVRRFGAPVQDASIAMIMLHGRGASAGDIAALAEVLPSDGCAFAAPQASGNTWYPHSFLMPRRRNEPYLSSALATIDGLVQEFERAGLAAERILLLGFSQGACLTAEYAARTPRRYAGVLALAGGLVGDRIDPAEYTGLLEGTPVFLGCSDQDPYIPQSRVEETAGVLQQLQAEVTMVLYPGLPHTVNDDEIEHVRAIMHRAARAKEAQ